MNKSKPACQKNAEAIKNRLIVDYLLTPYQADYLTSSRSIADFFIATHESVELRLDKDKARKTFIPADEQNLSAEFIQKEVAAGQAKLVANWIMGELFAHLNKDNLSIDQSPINTNRLAGLVLEIAHGNISGKIAKQVFEALWQSTLSADEIIAEKGLKQITDTGAIETIIDKIIADNPGQVEQYRSGKDKVFAFFVGQVMKEMQGKANPAEVNKMLKEKLQG